MQKFNCLIIEDEPLAAEVLQDYVKQTPFLELVGVCNDAIHAMDILQGETIDLIFLDIHLPKIKGIDFIKTIPNRPHIIITTAYHEYALKAFEYHVLDYLLKPIEFSRFLAAVKKIYLVDKIANHQSATKNNQPNPYMFFTVNKRRIKIKFEDILYVESMKEYVRIATLTKTIVTKCQLSQVEEMLTHENFIRVHRSYIVAKNKIDAFTASELEIGGKLIPVGRSYKEIFGT